MVDYCIVTGDIIPNATGNYFKAGTYGGKPYYRRTDGAYFIWWGLEGNAWFITVLLGVPGDYGWQRINANINGEYQPIYCEGIATVSVGIPPPLSGEIVIAPALSGEAEIIPSLDGELELVPSLTGTVEIIEGG